MTASPTAPGFSVPDGHRTAERRSLAMHRSIASTLTAAQLQRARDRVAQWSSDGSVDPRWAAQWSELLQGSVGAVAERIGRDDPEMTQLRQTTPFAGALPNAVRWRILREVR